MEICTNPDILRVILFIKEILKIVLFIVPIGLIIMLGLDLFKNISAGREEDMKKNVNIAIKRLIYAVILFLVPTVVNFTMNLLGDLGVPYMDCYNNAESTTIENYTINQAQAAIDKLTASPTRENLIEAQSAIENIKDKDIKENLNSTIISLEQVIVAEEKKNISSEDLSNTGEKYAKASKKEENSSSSSEKDSESGNEEKGGENGENTENEHLTTGIQGRYFAPVQQQGLYFYGSPIPHDIGASANSPLYAGMDGTATFEQWTTTQSGETVLASYGNVIILTSSDGKKIIYAHLSRFVSEANIKVKKTCVFPCSANDYPISKISAGTKTVKKGELIGYTGTTGNSTGPHLHVEIYENGARKADLDTAFGYK